jgi:hypothetical protein
MFVRSRLARSFYNCPDLTPEPEIYDYSLEFGSLQPL